MPRFLRFRNVIIDLIHSIKTSEPITMAKRCKLQMTMLRQFPLAFQGCALTFKSRIFPSCGKLCYPQVFSACFHKQCICRRSHCHFANYTNHLAYIRDKLIAPLFDRCSSYKFETDIVEPMCLPLSPPIRSIDIVGLLAIDSIQKCSHVNIRQNGGSWIKCRLPNGHSSNSVPQK